MKTPSPGFNFHRKNSIEVVQDLYLIHYFLETHKANIIDTLKESHQTNSTNNNNNNNNNNTESTPSNPPAMIPGSDQHIARIQRNIDMISTDKNNYKVRL